jgi:hypothetical protein
MGLGMFRALLFHGTKCGYAKARQASGRPLNASIGPILDFVEFRHIHQGQVSKVVSCLAALPK